MYLFRGGGANFRYTEDREILRRDSNSLENFKYKDPKQKIMNLFGKRTYFQNTFFLDIGEN